MNPAASPDTAAPHSLFHVVWQPERNRTALCYLLIFAITWCCFVRGRAEPAHLFWDENYHVTSAERYIEGIAQLEPHPPLGLMLIAAGEELSGTNQDIDKHSLVNKKQIPGEELPRGFDFSGMRLMPSLFAAFGALAFFGLMLSLFENRLHALLLSGLYLFENAFTVHLRAVHLDSFQLFFCIASLWRFISLWRRTTPLSTCNYAGLTALVTLGIMVKVNAVVLLLLPPILYAHEAVRQRAFKPQDLLRKASLSLLSLFAVTFAVFYVHATLTRQLPNQNTPAGGQDIANMSPEYQRYLREHQPLTPFMVITIARDYFKFMEKDHKGVPKLDTSKPGENGSHPLHWPFHDRNINYRWDSANGKTAYVELVGNQLAWYSGTVAVVFSLLLIVNHRLFGVHPACSPRTYQLIEIFTGLYVAFMVMNLWLISQRVMYLYHYFIGLVLSYVLLALAWQYCSETSTRFARYKTEILAGTMTLYLASYLFFLPLSNHWPLTKAECEKRNIWISHIVSCH